MKRFFASLLALGCWSLLPHAAAANPFQLSHSGRLIEASGKPVAGPIDLQLKFYTHPTNATLIAVTIPVFEDVTLSNGVYQLPLSLTGAEYQTAFGGTGDVWVEVKDVTHDKTYPRQRFMAVPYALQVPVDGVTVRFNAAGQLETLTGGSGDMTKVQYDTNAATTNTVDLADHATTADTAANADDAADAALFNGQGPAFYHDAANLTGNVAYARLPVGTVANTVAAGNDARMTNSRAPSGAASGDLGGTYPNPTVASVSDGALSANVSKLGSLISLSGEVENILPVANGGTGVGTLTGLVKANGTGAFTAAALADIPVGYRLNASDGTPTDALFVDASGSVGIGTATPSGKLEIHESADAGVHAIAINPNVGTGAFAMLAAESHLGAIQVQSFASAYPGGMGGYGRLRSESALNGLYVEAGGTKPIGFRTDNITRMTIDATGNVGIGMDPSGAKLQVYESKDGMLDAQIRNDNAGTNAMARMLVHNGGSVLAMEKASNTYAATGAREAGFGSLVDSGAGLNIAAAGAGSRPIRFYTGGVAPANERMRILGDGSVGIGTTAPLNKLDVEGGAVIGAAYSGNNTAPANGLLVEGDVGIGYYPPSARLEVGIGATASMEPALALTNSGSANDETGSEMIFRANRAGPTMTNFAGIGGKITDTTAGAYKGALVFSTADNAVPAERVRIDHTGNVGIGTDTPTAKLEIGGVAGTDGIKFPDGTLQTSAAATSALKHCGDTSGITGTTTSATYVTAAPDLTCSVSATAGEVFAVFLSCNMKISSSAFATYMRGTATGTGTWLLAPNQITISNVNWVGGASHGIFHATATGTVDFAAEWYTTGGTTAQYVYCNVSAHKIGTN